MGGYILDNGQTLQVDAYIEHLERELDQAYGCLRGIANTDYRGNRNPESVAAHRYLEFKGRRDR